MKTSRQLIFIFLLTLLFVSCRGSSNITPSPSPQEIVFPGNSALIEKTKTGDCPQTNFVDQIKKGADYITRLQNADGAIPDAQDSALFNLDNSMGYALAGLYYAYLATQDSRYLDSVKKAIAWQASVQDPDGSWHLAYARCSGGYCSTVPSALYPGVADIKTVDAIQLFFVYNLWLVSLSGNDQKFVQQYLGNAKRGIDRLLADNRDAEGRFFYSSSQKRGDVWQRFGVKYAMGQGDVYVGLMAAWKLFGEDKYYNAAKAIVDHFDPVFWDGQNRRYAIGVSGDNSIVSGEYLLAQAMPTFFFHQISEHSRQGLDYLKLHRLPSGAIAPADSSSQDTIFVAAFSLAAQVLGETQLAKDANNYLVSMQVRSNSPTDGAILFNQMRETNSLLYINQTAFSIMALCGVKGIRID